MSHPIDGAIGPAGDKRHVVQRFKPLETFCEQTLDPKLWARQRVFRSTIDCEPCLVGVDAMYAGDEDG